LKEDEINYKMV